MRTKLFLSSLVFLMFIVFSCNNQPKKSTENSIEIGKTTVDSISYFSAQASTLICCIKGHIVTQYGHCWSTNRNATTSDFKTNFGYLDEPQIFNSSLIELYDDSIYYIRAYAVYSYDTEYGEELTIHTLKTGFPVVETNNVTNIGLYNARCGGNVYADSGFFRALRGGSWNYDYDVGRITNRFGYKPDAYNYDYGFCVVY